jgi:hypothetical protein
VKNQRADPAPFPRALPPVLRQLRPEKVDEWTLIVIKAGEALLSFQVDSWQNGVNRSVEGRTVRRVLGYNGNGAHFRRTTDEVAKGGYQEFSFR